MEWVKRLTGFVAALFCTLVTAWLCSFLFKIDWVWYGNLVKPSVMPSPFLFTCMVSVMYASVIMVITRLVVGKFFFPSMVILFATGFLAVLFVYSMFWCKAIYFSTLVAGVLFGVSFALQLRFFTKDIKIALFYLPTFIFNTFSFILMFCLAMNN